MVSVADVIFTFGIMLTVTATVLGGIAAASENLFIAQISAGTDQKDFRKIVLHFGIFSTSATITLKNSTTQVVTGLQNFNRRQFNGAKAMSLVGLVAGILAIIVHLVLVADRHFRRWFFVLLELSLLLTAVLSVVICIALCETQFRLLEREGTGFLLNMVTVLKLEIPKSGPNKRIPLSLRITGPLIGFWIQVIEDFCLLLALLCSVPQFVKITEKEEAQNKRHTVTINEIGSHGDTSQPQDWL